METPRRDLPRSDAKDPRRQPRPQAEAAATATAAAARAAPEGEELPKWLEPEPKPHAGNRTTASAPETGTSLKSREEARARPADEPPPHPPRLNASLTVLQGVGPRHAQTLGQLGMNTLGDMLYYFPRRYEDYSQLKPIKNLWVNEQVTVIGAVQSVATRPIKGGKAQIVEVVITDGTGALRLSWFNQPWIANRMKTGDNVAVSGKLDQYLGRLVMNNPDVEPVEAEHLHTNRIVPIYPLTAKITQKWLRGLMNQVVNYWAPTLVDHLPDSIRTSAGLPALGRAILQAHFPDSQDELKKARARLAFDEIFFLQMGVLGQKRDWQSATARRFEISDEWLERALSRPALHADRRADPRRGRDPPRPLPPAAR